MMTSNTTHAPIINSPDNSKREGCKDKDIVYCRTDSGRNDHFCRFDGTKYVSLTLCVYGLRPCVLLF